MNRISGTKNGGGCELIQCSGILEGCIFLYNSASYGGGFWLSIPNGGSFIIKNNLFSENAYYNSKGGGFYVESFYEGDIISNTFIKNSASVCGGGFYINNGMNGNITDNTFNENTSRNFGGGFFINGSIIGDIIENIFSLNSCSDSKTSSGNSVYTITKGGGFYISGEVDGSITKNIFNENFCLANSLNTDYHPQQTVSSISEGGSFFIKGDLNGYIDYNEFNKNHCSANSISTSDYLGVWWNKCISDSYGGAFYIDGALNGNILMNTFEENYSSSYSESHAWHDNSTSTSSGGGFYVNLNFTGEISGNTYIRNYSSSVSSGSDDETSSSSIASGGGFCISGIFSGNIFDNIINENSSNSKSYSNNSSANSYGGGFSLIGNVNGNISGNTISIDSSNSESSTFKNSRDKLSGYSYGGGFYIGSCLNGEITNNCIKMNTSSDVSSWPDSTINSAYSYSTGGGFFINSILYSSVLNNIFIGNSSAASPFFRSASPSIHCSYGGGFSINSSFIGNIYGNTFSKNHSELAYDNSYGGGFYIKGDLNGNLAYNIFCENYADYDYYISFGGGLYLETLNGNIKNNIFNGNYAGYGGGFRIKFFMGEITSNIFSNNYANEGGGFKISDKGIYPDDAVISNNLLLYNNINKVEKLRGAGFYSNQNVTIINNTFYGGSVSESCVNITNNASESIFKNNIFANLDTAIWEEGELELIINNNNFYNTTNILYRNNIELGNDMTYIQLLVPNFSNNYDWEPELMGENTDIGTWTDNPLYDDNNNCTVFTDLNKSWEVNEWTGAMINLSNSTTTKLHFFIIGNSTNQIKVNGNLIDAGLGIIGHTYTIDDYHLKTVSQNIDKGTDVNLIEDFESDPRPIDNGFDVGADEYWDLNSNYLPEQPSSPSPPDQSSNISLTTKLDWADCLRASSYDLYLWKSSDEKPPTPTTSNLTISEYDPPSNSDYGTEYKWQVIAKNSKGNTLGAEWKFTTQIAPPEEPSTPLPTDTSTNISITTNLDWSDSARATSYDLYLWKSSDIKPSTPTASDLTVSEYDPVGNLDYDTEYKWQAIAKNTTGNTPGAEWKFTTSNLPSAIIDTPVGDQEILTGDSINFSGTATGYNLTYLWKFDGATPDSNQEDPGDIIFNQRGLYTIIFGVKDEWQNYASDSVKVIVKDPAPDLVSLKLLDQSDFSEEETDSQLVKVEIETTGSEPTHIILSEKENFDGAYWQLIQNPIIFRLTSKNGPKTVYAKVGGLYVNDSNVLSDSILLNTYDNSHILSDTIPSEMSPGQKYKVLITLQNTGASIWPQGWDLYRLGAVGDSDPLGGNARYPMPKDVYPNDEVIVEFYLTAPPLSNPPNPDTYTTDWRMVKEWEHWFGEKLVKQVTVKDGLKKNNSAYVTDYIPEEVSLKQPRLFIITFKNTGNATWTKTDLYKLGISGDRQQLGCPGRVELTNDIFPGEETTVNFWINPTQEGEYTITLRMLQEYVEWFGEAASKTIKVVKYTEVDEKIFELYE